MINALALLACCVVSHQEAGIRFFHFHMDNGLERPWSVWRGEAIQWSEPAEWLRPWVAELEALFIPVPPRKSRKLADIAIALFDGKRWLFVDRLGPASLGGSLGRFDVVKYEQLLRRLPHPMIDRIGWDRLITFRIRNCSHKLVEVLDSSGKTVLKTRSGQAEATTWFCSHEILINGKKEAETDGEIKNLLPTKSVTDKLSLAVWQREREPERWSDGDTVFDTTPPDNPRRYVAEVSVDCKNPPSEAFLLTARDFVVKITETQVTMGQSGDVQAWWGAVPTDPKIIAISDLTVSFGGKQLIVPRSLYTDLANPADLKLDSTTGTVLFTISGGTWPRPLVPRRNLEGTYKAVLEITPSSNRIVRTVSLATVDNGPVQRTEFQPVTGK